MKTDCRKCKFARNREDAFVFCYSTLKSIQMVGNDMSVIVISPGADGTDDCPFYKGLAAKDASSELVKSGQYDWK